MSPSDSCRVYGPVPSRRLGQSLGIDLVPSRTCSYDCVYCQLGRTTNKTIWRKEYVRVELLLANLKKGTCDRSCTRLHRYPISLELPAEPGSRDMTDIRPRNGSSSARRNPVTAT
jgi:wyosine [tRNA(Phe)-imidazoG37] synthetase (radical SAM superfamily)